MSGFHREFRGPWRAHYDIPVWYRSVTETGSQHYSGFDAIGDLDLMGPPAAGDGGSHATTGAFQTLMAGVSR